MRASIVNIITFTLAVTMIGCGKKEATESQVNECKQLIYSHNGYEPSRMDYIEMKSDGSIIIKYHRTTSNKTWTLRCYKGEPQVWADGGKVWLDI
ncbi:hypothetical protein [Photobacterium sanguinicancri]|uniref:hypothetical protein n=1 Tax=Photobacterium sanguinicancri TaxID=875932 RepID=UPI003D09A81C